MNVVKKSSSTNLSKISKIYVEKKNRKKFLNRKIIKLGEENMIEKKNRRAALIESSVFS